MTTALVLAGTRPGGDPFANELGLKHKCLIELEGQTLLERVICALRSAGIERIVVSCNEDTVGRLAEKLGAETIETGQGPSSSVARAFEKYGAPMIVTTSDHALLDAAWVQQLVSETPSEVDLAVMLAEKALVELAMPGSKRTYLRFADGHWSGCNLFYLQTSQASRALETWSLVEADRKRPWRIAARLGAGTLLSMLIGRLTLASALERLGQRVGVRAALISADDGLAAVDIDKVADLEAVESYLSRRKAGTSASEV